MTAHFAGIDKEFAGFVDSRILLQPVPYDGTSTWGKGADRGFEAFLDAAENMELYDIETNSEVYRQGIHVLNPITESSSPEDMTLAVYNKTRELLETGKFLTFFGGEHSISIGVMQAFYEKYPDITILQLDAHADLRPNYDGSECNHACTVHQASKYANLIQVGIRSMDIAENEFLNQDKCYFAHQIMDNQSWMEKSIGQMTGKVYITIDLDVFDPSVMPATGTPEPGGMTYYQVTNYLKQVFKQKEVVGFDIVELAPIKGLKHPQFLAAKLYYQLLSYKFHLHDK